MQQPGAVRSKRYRHLGRPWKPQLGLQQSLPQHPNLGGWRQLCKLYEECPCPLVSPSTDDRCSDRQPAPHRCIRYISKNSSKCFTWSFWPPNFAPTTAVDVTPSDESWRGPSLADEQLICKLEFASYEKLHEFLKVIYPRSTWNFWPPNFAPTTSVEVTPIDKLWRGRSLAGEKIIC